MCPRLSASLIANSDSSFSTQSVGAEKLQTRCCAENPVSSHLVAGSRERSGCPQSLPASHCLLCSLLNCMLFHQRPSILCGDHTVRLSRSASSACYGHFFFFFLKDGLWGRLSGSLASQPLSALLSLKMRCCSTTLSCLLCAIHDFDGAQVLWHERVFCELSCVRVRVEFSSACDRRPLEMCMAGFTEMSVWIGLFSSDNYGRLITYTQLIFAQKGCICSVVSVETDKTSPFNPGFILCVNTMNQFPWNWQISRQ